MKSKFFKDTQGLEGTACAPDKVCVCLRLSRLAYDAAVFGALRQGTSTGQYVETLLLANVPAPSDATERIEAPRRLM